MDKKIISIDRDEKKSIRDVVIQAARARHRAKNMIVVFEDENGDLDILSSLSNHSKKTYLVSYLVAWVQSYFGFEPI